MEPQKISDLIPEVMLDKNSDKTEENILVKRIYDHFILCDVRFYRSVMENGNRKFVYDRQAFREAITDLGFQVTLEDPLRWNVFIKRKESIELHLKSGKTQTIKWISDPYGVIIDSNESEYLALSFYMDPDDLSRYHVIECDSSSKDMPSLLDNYRDKGTIISCWSVKK